MLEQIAFPELFSESDSGAVSISAYRRPFLKWAGGKFKVLPKIFGALPSGTRLVEPFAGSAVVALNAPFVRRVAADTNKDLINLYRSVVGDPAQFISEAASLFVPENNERRAYEALREEFNGSDDPFRRSVIFVYLNRHCFNGLCRYNAKGRFNVPFGRYRNPTFPLREVEHFASAARSIEFKLASFEETMRAAKPGDVIYCDPPYVPLSLTANFTGYTEGSFGLAEQQRLAELARELAGKGIPVVISNHDTDFTQAIYKGAHIETFGVQRNISCDGGNRSHAPELLAVFQ